MSVAATRPRSRAATVFQRGRGWLLSGGVMPLRKLFESEVDADEFLRVSPSSAGMVEVYITDSDHVPRSGFVALDPDDIPALIAELRRVAKLAKEARHG